MILLALVASLVASAPDAGAAGFVGSHAPLSAETMAAMRGVSWREGCPVPLGELESVRVSYFGFDGQVHTDGELVVHREVAGEVLELFEALFAARFPIEKIRPIEAYGGDDDRAMADNATSAFNCRPNSSDPSKFSRHSYGRAIDLNPVQNPYVTRREVRPPAGRAFLERSGRRAGKGVIGAEIRRIFEKRGWVWGGGWRRLKDYQHFEKP